MDAFGSINLGEILGLSYDSDSDNSYDNYPTVDYTSNEEMSSALVTTSNSSLVFKEATENAYEVDSLRFEGLFDEKIIYICNLMFNKKNNRPHNYKNMSVFLKHCIAFTDDVIELIDMLATLISEDGNFFAQHGLKNTIESYFNSFRSNCESIRFFHENQINANLLNDLYDTLLNYLSEKNYFVDDFNNTDFLYSNVGLTWNVIRMHLKIYQKSIFEKYQEIRYVKPIKTIAWYNIPARIMNYFNPTIEGTVTVRQTTPQIEYPVIQNRITYGGLDYQNNNPRMITSY